MATASLGRRLDKLEQAAQNHRSREMLVMCFWDQDLPAIPDGVTPNITHSAGGWIRYEDFRSGWQDRVQPDDDPTDCHFLLFKTNGNYP